jgi:lycopene beta-cyclase
MSALRLTLKTLPPMRSYHVLIGAWVLTMIAQPIVRWLYGDQYLSLGVGIAVLCQTGAVLAVLLPAWGRRRVLIAVVGIIASAWLVEYIGSTTGLPFGAYHYTDRLQPQLGHVPVIIPLAWLMMLPPAWAVASAILRPTLRPYIRRLGFVVITALAFTAWDLFLDPQMVRWGFWVWDQPGAYFGIPLLNFVGWMLASVVITALVYGVLRPPAVPIRPLLTIYAITWVLETLGLAVFWGMVGPALIGCAAMGGLLLVAIRAEVRP